MPEEPKIPIINHEDIEKFSRTDTIITGRTPVNPFNNPEYQAYANQKVQDAISNSIKVPDYSDILFKNPVVEQLKKQIEQDKIQICELQETVDSLTQIVDKQSKRIHGFQIL